MKYITMVDNFFGGCRDASITSICNEQFKDPVFSLFMNDQLPLALPIYQNFSMWSAQFCQVYVDNIAVIYFPPKIKDRNICANGGFGTYSTVPDISSFPMVKHTTAITFQYPDRIDGPTGKHILNSNLTET
jgi:hypothetical protein